jgi:hypothetical protein
MQVVKDADKHTKNYKGDTVTVKEIL